MVKGLNLHIITLNIPYPPDYGGMIDTFYRLRSLADLNVRIHLHCFEYGRKHSTELEKLCETTNYYTRRSSLLRQLSTIPYIISSRVSLTLLKTLSKDNYPILFDGIHSTYYLNHPALSGRRKIVRLHNIEHEYYASLGSNESNLLKKAYFQIESAKLKRYEKILEFADITLPISESDQVYFKNKYHNSVFLAPFHPFHGSQSLPGMGEYIIYHGDLSVNENAEIAGSLISNVFSKVTCQCIIAGKDPSRKLISSASRFSNIRVISNPDNALMTSLIANAHINLLPALSSNGFKLKLLFALYAGRHCLVNSVVGKYTSIRSLCHVVDSDDEMIIKIHILMNEPFTHNMIQERMKVLSTKFDITNNTKKLIELIY